LPAAPPRATQRSCCRRAIGGLLDARLGFAGGTELGGDERNLVLANRAARYSQNHVLRSGVEAVETFLKELALAHQLLALAAECFIVRALRLELLFAVRQFFAHTQQLFGVPGQRRGLNRLLLRMRGRRRRRRRQFRNAEQLANATRALL